MKNTKGGASLAFSRCLSLRICRRRDDRLTREINLIVRCKCCVWEIVFNVSDRCVCLVWPFFHQLCTASWRDTYRLTVGTTIENWNGLQIDFVFYTLVSISRLWCHLNSSLPKLTTILLDLFYKLCIIHCTRTSTMHIILATPPKRVLVTILNNVT